MYKYIKSAIGILIFLTSCNNGDDQADAFGNFETRETIVAAEVNGKIIKLEIDEGQVLKANELIGIIDTIQLYLNFTQVAAKKKSVQAKLSTIDANVKVLEAQKESLETELKRVKKLIEDDAATTQKLDDLEGKLDVLNNQIKSTLVQKNSIYAEIQSMYAQLAMIEDQIQKCKIINPIDGTVLEKYVEPHELVAAGKSIYKIADLSEMDLRVYVSGSQLSDIKIGQEITVMFDKNKDENSELKGIITWISSKAEFTPKIIQTKEERVNLVYAVKVKVKNDGSIKIGMPGEIKW
ncbi:MAG: HlyD family efflux transporter periplasmic adaptor subunit [Bacteroidales bacterium]|nr:HlyD family efflux transporter periplasmic adaptor subunit [Bacteroidales bacterium]